MSNLKERLDLLREEIQKDDFLDGKGLSNEVNIRIFCYDPAEEMTVTHFLDQIKIDQSLNCRLIECNLYKTFLSICDDLDITDAIPEMEEADGGIFLLEQLHSAIGEGEFIDKIQYEPHKRGDVLMLTVMCFPSCGYTPCWKHCSLTFQTFRFWSCTPVSLTAII